jgi:hypothetical protein
MEGRPFALLGINCDQELQTVQQASTRYNVTWPNWWNGGVHGSYTERYGVDRFPTALVLDANGMVRFRGSPQDPRMEETVEKLVREAERPRTGQAGTP